MDTSGFDGCDAYNCDIPSGLICVKGKNESGLAIHRDGWQSTYPIALKARHEFPGTVELATAM